jgi:5'-methylthioadenosine phosphorylase
MTVAFLGGTSIAESSAFSGWESGEITTEFGRTFFRKRGEHVVVNRHGSGKPLPAHAIDHRANIRAIADLGFGDVVAFSSVGSLRPGITPGTFVSCDDYVGLAVGPATFFDRELRGGAPGIANNLVPEIIHALAPEFTVATGLTYVQTRGPRFETRAEIRILKEWGDVVGMTAAHEADLCTELGLRYNSLGIVDNFANGIEGTAIDLEKFMGLVRSHQERVDRFILRVIEALS